VLTGDDQIAKYARAYHDHGHENNPNFPRGRDTKTIHGFNYRMTEMQAAVGKVQLGKLDKMLAANKERHRRLSALLGETYVLREQLEGSDSCDDAFIFFVEDEGVRGKVVALLQETGFGTKNLPGAVEWHCAAYWDHALSQQQIDRAEETKQLLETAVAVPIWLKRSATEYEVLAQQLLKIR
jgi:8-amino-3,8-dideoxy-alpha-D-manno-octulosonate transaminase